MILQKHYETIEFAHITDEDELALLHEPIDEIEEIKKSILNNRIRRHRMMKRISVAENAPGGMVIDSVIKTKGTDKKTGKIDAWDTTNTLDNTQTTAEAAVLRAVKFEDSLTRIDNSARQNIALLHKIKTDSAAQEQSGNVYNGLPARLLGKEYFEIDRDINSRKYIRYDNKGGRGSLKSSYYAEKVVDQIMLHPHLCALAVRQLVDDLRDSVYAQIVWAIDEMGLTDQFKCTKSPMQIVRKETGQIIYFRGAENPSKIKSIRPPNGMHIGIVWFEEFDQISGMKAYRNILQSAFRGGDEGIVFCSYNTPQNKQHWLNKNLREKDTTRVVYHTHYKNAPLEWLGQAFLDLAEHLRVTNPMAYAHEYDGEATGSGANVFENVKLRKITDAEIASFDRIYLGIDWGYFPDPAAFNAYYYHSASQRLYIFDEVTALKASNDKFADMINSKWKDTKITADSAEPKSIDDFRGLDFWIDGAIKGKGSVEFSTKWLASRAEIVIDSERCPSVQGKPTTPQAAKRWILRSRLLWVMKKCNIPSILMQAQAI